MAFGKCPPDFYSKVNAVSKLHEEAKLAWNMSSVIMLELDESWVVLLSCPVQTSPFQVFTYRLA